ncbi:glycosyltransferase involved in cell wall biosynthesis [Paenibacillus castaneae]|uniref:glycosyltransferase n=1 Tax=Paenibacillus castaneae TaxID=474957 RepID=UPI000C998BD3|nr:glycosyltransferase [Paenibacillus castaneae]NIK76094.1 glycosyltransferase involved in cell wall biosynthesis [Paenibacillus castaneae]
MKKKLLFVIPSLSAGGAERSLINLLTQIDFNNYEVDLFMFNHEGIFMDLLPQNVHVLPLSNNYNRFVRPVWNSVPYFILTRNTELAYSRIMFSYKNRMSRSVSIKEQKGWKYVAKSIDKIDKQYDIAIGFLEKTSIYFCTEKVNAFIKIGWVHNDYDKLGMNPNFDLQYFKRLDYIVTVSDECGNILKRIFPNQSEKIYVIHNIVSPAIINQLADKEVQDVYDRKKDEFVIVSIGRLHAQKGFELAIQSCKLLVERGIIFQWNIIGEGEERQKLTELIAAEGLEQYIKLLGLKANPYPYIKQADIYAQTSWYEGKAIAIDEAKILNKPIVITDFSTAKDQIRNGFEGLIVDMNADAIANGISTLIYDKETRERLTEHLSQLQLGTEEEINKLYKLLR